VKKGEKRAGEKRRQARMGGRREWKAGENGRQARMGGRSGQDII